MRGKNMMTIKPNYLRGCIYHKIPVCYYQAVMLCKCYGMLAPDVISHIVGSITCIKEINGIESGDCTKILAVPSIGLILDSKLTFNKHIDSFCKKSNATLAFIRRNTYFCQQNVNIDAYCTYVRPILEYAAFVWSPTLVTT